MTTVEYTRRTILRTSAIGGLGVALGGAATPSAEAEAPPAPKASPSQQDAIHEYYLSQGGAAGILGSPDGPVQSVRNSRGVPGLVQHYRGVSYGPTATCSHPAAGTPTVSTVVWSAGTGAHALRGAVRERWLKSGGAAGKYGFPTATAPAAAAPGASVRFEHGEIPGN
ncbi:hypothetical protein [Actinomadura rupiterrae]|uniref:hypothetical protein n=1 Tax=Actinomadura rupiterrae TaxID=559627 RepID=UPI0020A47373|nr:hypothetical protein [Actinomadura rupiterrae]MCP2342570.1 uncharacterized protein with LGFP repeats [Actinomadura rupiterrae]